ncbi:protein kinase [bacterium]|jgi:hypothetical protein|nr:protein kinase [bacterium]
MNFLKLFTACLPSVQKKTIPTIVGKKNTQDSPTTALVQNPSSLNDFLAFQEKSRPSLEVFDTTRQASTSYLGDNNRSASTNDDEWVTLSQVETILRVRDTRKTITIDTNGIKTTFEFDKRRVDETDGELFQYENKTSKRKVSKDYVGSGSSGRIRKGTILGTNEQIAARIFTTKEHDIKINGIKKPGQKSNFLQLSKLHPQFLPLRLNSLCVLKPKFHFIETKPNNTKNKRSPVKKRHYLIFDYMQNDLTKFTCINKAYTIEMCRHLITTVDHLHVNSIVHTDIKPDNFVRKENKMPKLIDFGDAEDFEWDKKTIAKRSGTINYMATELKTYDSEDDKRNFNDFKRADIASLGFTLYKILTASESNPGGSSLLGNRQEYFDTLEIAIATEKKELTKKLEENTQLTHLEKQLIGGLCEPNPNLRMTTEEALILMESIQEENNVGYNYPTICLSTRVSAP